MRGLGVSNSVSNAETPVDFAFLASMSDSGRFSASAVPKQEVAHPAEAAERSMEPVRSSEHGPWWCEHVLVPGVSEDRYEFTELE